MLPFGPELFVEQRIDELRREAERAYLAAQLEPRVSPFRIWVRKVLHRLAGVHTPGISADGVPPWPTLRNYPYGPPPEW
jgi:hypothetical protein